jgi:hypothetical protein
MTAYDYLTRTPSEYVAAARGGADRGPVGVGPTTGARTPQGRAAEAAFGMGKRDGSGSDVPWLWIGAGVLAVILIARR